jgi:hypothetical protein
MPHANNENKLDYLLLFKRWILAIESHVPQGYYFQPKLKEKDTDEKNKHMSVLISF